MFLISYGTCDRESYGVEGGANVPMYVYMSKFVYVGYVDGSESQNYVRTLSDENPEVQEG